MDIALRGAMTTIIQSTPPLPEVAQPPRARDAASVTTQLQEDPQLATTQPTQQPSHPRSVGVGSAASDAAGGEGKEEVPPHHLPTDSKEREKKRDAEDKSRGVEKIVKRKPRVIERHYDDCGDSLRG